MSNHHHFDITLLPILLVALCSLLFAFNAFILMPMLNRHVSNREKASAHGIRMSSATYKKFTNSVVAAHLLITIVLVGVVLYWTH
ncbi:hypothetical protein ABC974_07685 [Sphingomonas oligophenolica]|uniref:HIG1 domain-containing protein n=1 Tax=Sphingomonas oligophenolica TaxID=301154 RepID=A0ABU9Y154_9SPHN